jgi:hypothetical protein
MKNKRRAIEKGVHCVIPASAHAVAVDVQTEDNAKYLPVVMGELIQLGAEYKRILATKNNAPRNLAVLK